VSPTNSNPSGPNASGPTDFQSGVPFVISAAWAVAPASSKARLAQKSRLDVMVIPLGVQVKMLYDVVE